MSPLQEQVKPTTLLRLNLAAAIALPDSSMTASGFRAGENGRRAE